MGYSDQYCEGRSFCCPNVTQVGTKILSSSATGIISRHYAVALQHFKNFFERRARNYACGTLFGLGCVSTPPKPDISGVKQSEPNLKNKN